MLNKHIENRVPVRDDLDLVYGEGDTLSIVFDKATDKSLSTTGGDVLYARHKLREDCYRSLSAMWSFWACGATGMWSRAATAPGCTVARKTSSLA